MKRLLLPLIAAFAFPTVVNAGIPKEFEDRYMVAADGKDSTWLVDTEDIEVKGSVIRLNVQRTVKNADKDSSVPWRGRLRIDCKKFEQKAELKGGATTLGGLILGGGYSKTPWIKITKKDVSYKFADDLCYLTGVKGYTKNEDNPEWVLKVVETVESKPIKKYSEQGSIKINCDSPVWKNKPRCN